MDIGCEGRRAVRGGMGAFVLRGCLDDGAPSLKEKDWVGACLGDGGARAEFWAVRQRSPIRCQGVDAQPVVGAVLDWSSEERSVLGK